MLTLGLFAVADFLLLLVIINTEKQNYTDGRGICCAAYFTIYKTDVNVISVNEKLLLGQQ